MEETNKPNSERFLNAYCDIEKFLRKITKKGKKSTFSELVREGANINKGVRHFKKLARREAIGLQVTSMGVQRQYPGFINRIRIHL